ncbi:PucR family transcriptional regulator [Nocardia fluminea]|uniref:PucR-like helix-turn-helix protein n=1 Tax=Nocardia fluminea TaxID=134984 RepID=A0A2N3WXS5_9NOCA|nr:helix-turn-helix domain-containing protein [Nocardia fluminea]PKV98676.1 PucR-like helix-turn-helix protein [Nocardia fluminea]
MGVHEVNHTITRMVDSAMSAHSASDEVREQLLTLASRSFASATDLDSDAAAQLERAVAGCVRLGVSLDTTLSIVIGAMELVISIETPPTADSVLRAVRAATEIVARVYKQARSNERVDEGRAVAAALLRGDSAKILGHCSHIGVADSYTILAMRLPPLRGRHREGPPTATEPVAPRMHFEVRRRFGPSALTLLADNGATILIPDTAPNDYAALAAFNDCLATADGTVPTALTMHALTTDLPAVAEQVHAALDLATRLGMTGRLYRFSDIAVEYQLTRPGPGRDALSTVLDPLEEHPDLLATLRCYIDSGLDRRRTARRLHLHPNSVDYRLKRILRLTGYDSTDPTGLWNLRSALVIRDHHTEYTALGA